MAISETRGYIEKHGKIIKKLKRKINRRKMKKKLLALAIVLALVAAMIVPTAVYAGNSSSVGGTLAITLVSIAVTPNPATTIVVPGFGGTNTEQFTATGTYSNGAVTPIASGVTWASETLGVATISSTGLASAVAPGQTNITAQVGTVTSPEVTLSVAGHPTIVDNPVTVFGTTTATLTASVNPNGADTKYTLQWGTNPGVFPNTVSTDIGSGYAVVQISVNLTGLTPGTKYYFNVVASNGLGQPPTIYFGTNQSWTAQTYNSVSISVPSSLNLPALVAGANTADWGATNTSSVTVTAGTDGVTPNWMVTATGSKFMTNGGTSLNEPLLISPDGSTWSCADGTSTGTTPYTYGGTYTKNGTGTVASSAIDLYAEQSISASDSTAGSYTDTITFQISVAQ
jgi:hypothetical protein